MIRIVRLELKPENCSEFEVFFEKTKDTIASMPGCNGVKLYKDADLNNVYYTHSDWDSVDALNAYRDSEFFKKTWAYTKTLFQNRASAFSLIDL